MCGPWLCMGELPIGPIELIMPGSFCIAGFWLMFGFGNWLFPGAELGVPTGPEPPTMDESDDRDESGDIDDIDESGVIGDSGEMGMFLLIWCIC